jgi:tetratricopeptide (TPR) repeat protein
MRKVNRWMSGVAIFFVGAAVGVASSKLKVEPSMYQSKTPAAAASDLLHAGESLAGDDTWQEIAVGRVYYLSGKKTDAQEVFNRVLLSKKVKGADYIRIARVYLEAKEWDKAKPLLEKVVELEPKDEDWLAEIGAWYNLHGDRAHAEELFARSIQQDSSNVYNTAKMAGSYVGVPPG